MKFSFSLGRFTVGLCVIDRHASPAPSLWQVVVWRDCRRGWQSVGLPQPFTAATKLQSMTAKANPDFTVKIVAAP